MKDFCIHVRENLAHGFLSLWRLCLVSVLMSCKPYRVRKYFLCFYLPEETVNNWYNVFPQCLVKITSEPMRAWCFLFWKVNCWFNRFNRYRSVQIHKALLCEFWEMHLSKNWLPSSRSQSVSTGLLIVPLSYHSHLRGICGDVPFSFLLLVIFILSLSSLAWLESDWFSWFFKNPTFLVMLIFFVLISYFQFHWFLL